MRRPIRPLPVFLPALLAVGLVACDDDPSEGDPADAAPLADMAPDPDPDQGPVDDMGPTADMGPVDDMGPPPEECVLPDIERGGGLVATTRGLVQGREADGVWSWQGIPFVAPPVGDLRFRPPQPHACWDDVKLADGFGPKCPQVEVGLAGVQTVGEEDCLTLNVWSPTGDADGGARPVLFFIHGGANIIGSASETIAPGRYIYDGAALAARGDAVVVTIQYRLGPLGFMTLPELDAEGEAGTSGNYALMDQLAALGWVRDNIEAFGGDPTRVMVFGESAGALNTCMMIATPMSRGLMHRALMQSGGCGAAAKVAAQMGSVTGAELAGCAGDDRLSCLRAMDAHTLVEEASGSVGLGDSPTDNGLSWGPVVDGHVLPDTPLALIAAGEHTAVPTVVGSNADEMASRALNRLTVETPEDYTRAVQVTFGLLGADALDRIFETYPVDAFESPDDAFIQVATDAFFTCGARRVARTLAMGQQQPVYRYFFSRRFETAMGEGRAQHGIELLYVFRSLEAIPAFQPNASELAVADQMMDAWLNLAADGDPGGGPAGDWPPYALETEPSQVFDDPPAVEDGVRAAKCDLWDELLAGIVD